MTQRPVRRAALLLSSLLLTGTATACAGSTEPAPPDDGGGAAAPSPSIRTFSPMPAPDTGPPEGEVVADLRQSSRDAALGRFQVWVGNGTAGPLLPERLVYRDPRLTRTLEGQRLRSIPSGSWRGFPLALPDRLRCGERGTRPPTLALRAGEVAARIVVEDEADVVARHVATRCFTLALDQAVTLALDDAVPLVPGSDDVAILTLRVTPTGMPGHRVTVRSVSGTPVLTPPGRPVWRPRAELASDGRPVTLELPVGPARCDPHAFAESGGATAFRVRLLLDGRPGEVVVRMSERGALAALDFAREACDLGGG